MADEKYQIELEVHSGSAAQEIQQIDQKINKLGLSAIPVKQKIDQIFNLKKKRAEAVYNLGLLQKELQKTGKAAGKQGAAGNFSFFGTQLGYLASDARYGLLAVGNNLSFLTTQFFQLSKSSKAAGSSFGKEFMKSLAGPAGMIIALQVLIAVLPEIVKWIKGWGDESKNTAKAIKELSGESTKLSEQILEENKELEKITDSRKAEVKFMVQQIGQRGKLTSLTKANKEILGDLIDETDFYNLSAKEQILLLNRVAYAYGNVEKAAEGLAEGIVQEETSDKVLSILGLTSEVQNLGNKADIAIKKLAARAGTSYAEASEAYWDSPAGQIMSAKIINAEAKAKDKADKDSAAARAKARAAARARAAFLGRFTDGTDEEKIDTAEKGALARAKELGISKEQTQIIITYYAAQRDALKAKKIKAANDFAEGFGVLSEGERIEKARAAALARAMELGLTPEQTAQIGVYFDDQQTKLQEKKDAIAKKKQDAEDAERQKALDEIDGIEGKSEQDKLNAEIESLTEHLNKKRITLEEYEMAVASLKKKYARAELSREAGKLQQLHALTGQFGGLAIAGVVMDQGAALFDIVKGTVARVKHIKNLPDPTGITQGVLIAKEVASGAISAGITVASAKRSIDQIRGAGGKGGRGGGGGSKAPNFNVIGATGTNQLKETIDNQTENLNNKMVKAYVVEDESQAARMEIKDAETQTSF